VFIGFVQAQEADEPHDLLIRNATLMDPGGTSWRSVRHRTS
jgi:hypothetical protein